jgi:SAM-dependent methyltransferase
MTPIETAQSYNKLASHWDSEKFNRKNGIEQHKKALKFVKEKGCAIDIGCGSSGRIIDLLISEGFDTEALDISPEMVRLAKQRNQDVTIHLADICEWDLPRRYDFISAWDSIWHASLLSQEGILRKLCGGLREGGILIFTSGGTDGPDERTNPFLGQPLYHAAPGIPKLLTILADSGCICRHLEYDQPPEEHIYLIAQKATPGASGYYG